MDEPDASHGVSDLLDRFIAVQLHDPDSVKSKARLKRIAFTFLLGLDKNVEVMDRRGFLSSLPHLLLCAHTSSELWTYCVVQGI